MRFRNHSASKCTAVTGRSGAARIDPLAAFSDMFATGSQDPTVRGWTRTDDSTTPAGDGALQNYTTCVTPGTGLRMLVDSGGGTGSLHFAANRGVHIHKEITAARWAVETRVTVTNAALNADPPTTNYRMGGLLAHSPHANANVEHVALFFGTVQGGGPRVYRAQTTAAAGGTTQPDGGSVPGFQASASLTGGFTRYLRLLRNRDDSDRWVLQYSADGLSWTTQQNVQRGANAMPNTVRVGMALSSDVGGSPDCAVLFHYMRFFTPPLALFS